MAISSSSAAIYRVIYHAGDKAVDQWSNTASVLEPGIRSGVFNSLVCCA